MDSGIRVGPFPCQKREGPDADTLHLKDLNVVDIGTHREKCRREILILKMFTTMIFEHSSNFLSPKRKLSGQRADEN